MRVLPVEDEVRLAGNLGAALRDGLGFAVDWADDCSLLVSNPLLNSVQDSPPASAVEIRLTIDGDDAVPENEGHGDGAAAPAMARPSVVGGVFGGA